MLKDDEVRRIENNLYVISLYVILYLNSGYVLSRAFDKIIEKMSEEKSITEKIFCYMKRISVQKNTSFETELFSLSRELKSRELMRFASIINDNKNKGSMLADKLERERVRMQSERINAAKANAKKAETKLCFPLTLLLLALVLICIAPAMMTM